jgi:hypothetical protein
VPVLEDRRTGLSPLAKRPNTSRRLVDVDHQADEDLDGGQARRTGLPSLVDVDHQADEDLDGGRLGAPVSRRSLPVARRRRGRLVRTFFRHALSCRKKVRTACRDHQADEDLDGGQLGAAPRPVPVTSSSSTTITAPTSSASTSTTRRTRTSTAGSSAPRPGAGGQGPPGALTVACHL